MKKSKWQQYIDNLGDTRPWHLLDHSKLVDNPKISEDRLEVCKGCSFYLSLTTQCKKCGCVMSGKVRLESAKCPIGKW
jgi:hypothetical protein